MLHVRSSGVRIVGTGGFTRRSMLRFDLGTGDAAATAARAARKVIVARSSDNEGGPGPLRNPPPIGWRQKLRHFSQFTLGQLLLLCVLCCVFMILVTPKIHSVFQTQQKLDSARKRIAAEAAANADLAAAMRSGDVALARHALEAGANVKPGSSMIKPQTPPLFASIARGQPEIMELLLDFGADAEKTEPLSDEDFSYPMQDGPPLFAAISCKQPFEVRAKMIRLLVARGVDPRKEVYGRNAMDLAFHLSDAQAGDLLQEHGLSYGPREMAAFNRLDELKLAVQEDPGLLQERFRSVYTAQGGNGPTLLAIALERGYREMAKFLIDVGAPLDTVIYRGTPLMLLAARGGDPELIRLLVRAGWRWMPSTNIKTPR